MSKSTTWRDILLLTDKGKYKPGDMVKTLGLDGQVRFATVKAAMTNTRGLIYYTFTDFLDQRHESVVWPLDVNDVEEVEGWLSQLEIE